MEQFLNILFSNNTDEIFDNFIEQINNIPFEEYRHEELVNFQLHERVVQNMYILRRNLELHSFNNPIPRSTPTRSTATRSTATRSTATRSTATRSTATRSTARPNFNTNNEIGNLISDIFDTFSTFLEDQINFVEDYSNLEDTKVVLTEQQFNTLNSVILNENDKGDCPICMESMNLNDNLIILQCKHFYHNSCIHEWLTKNSTKCCVCRKDVREELS
jgi:hypothetical protein